MLYIRFKIVMGYFFYEFKIWDYIKFLVDLLRNGRFFIFWGFWEFWWEDICFVVGRILEFGVLSRDFCRVAGEDVERDRSIYYRLEREESLGRRRGRESLRMSL